MNPCFIVLIFYFFALNSCTITHTKDTPINNINYSRSELQFVIYKGHELLLAIKHFEEVEECLEAMPEIKEIIFREFDNDNNSDFKSLDKRGKTDTSVIQRKVIRRGLNLTEIPQGIVPKEHEFVFLSCINREGYPTISKLIKSTSKERVVNNSFQKMVMNYLWERSDEDDCLACGKMTIHLDNVNTIQTSFR